MIGSALRLLVAVPVLIVATVTLAILAMLTGRVWSPEPYYQAFCRMVLALAGARVSSGGQDQLPAGHAVFVCNHESYIDIAALYRTAARPLRFVGKRSLFFIPFFGQALYLTGNLPVSRGKHANPARDLARTKDAMRRCSLFFFPEGTRSADGRLRPFKKGAFVTALRTGAPVVPVALAGAREVLPKGTLRITPGPVRVLYGAPIPTEGLGYDDRDALVKRCWLALVELRRRAHEDLGLPDEGVVNADARVPAPRPSA